MVTVSKITNGELQLTVHTTPNPLNTNAHPPTEPQQTLLSLPCGLLTSLDLCVARAHVFHRLHSSLCCSIAEVNPLLPGNRIKQWSQWDIARLMDSPPPPSHLRFSCAKVFIESWWRQPCMTLIHLNGPEKKWESFTHLQSWHKTNQEGCIESAFYLKMVQMFVYCFNAPCYGSGVVLVDFCRWGLYSAVDPLLSHTDSFFYPTTWQATLAGK